MRLRTVQALDPGGIVAPQGGVLPRRLLGAAPQPQLVQIGRGPMKVGPGGRLRRLQDGTVTSCSVLAASLGHAVLEQRGARPVPLWLYRPAS